MQEFTFSYQSIIDGQGFSLAFAGMTIVFVALTAVSTFIAVLPGILRVVNRYYPELDGHPEPIKPIRKSLKNTIDNTKWAFLTSDNVRYSSYPSLRSRPASEAVPALAWPTQKAFTEGDTAIM